MYDPNENITIYAPGEGYNRFRVADEIQNASNPSGVARELVKIISDAMNDPDYTGTDWVRNDPAVRMVVNKLFDLTRAENVWTDGGYEDALRRAKEREAQ